MLIVFFILLTALTAFSITDSTIEEVPKPLAQILEEPPISKIAKTENNSREPASTSEVKSQVSDQSAALVIFCDPKSLNFKSAAQLLILELTSCLELKEKHQLWVKNETNGFKAQIFKMTPKKFKTDFIQLNVGTNKIVLEGVLKDGQKIVQTLEILSGS